MSSQDQYKCKVSMWNKNASIDITTHTYSIYLTHYPLDPEGLVPCLLPLVPLPVLLPVSTPQRWHPALVCLPFVPHQWWWCLSDSHSLHPHLYLPSCCCVGGSKRWTETKWVIGLSHTYTRKKTLRRASCWRRAKKARVVGEAHFLTLIVFILSDIYKFSQH